MKKNGWAINLLFILAGAYFVSGAASSVIARSVRIVPTATPAIAPPGTMSLDKLSKPTDYQAMSVRNLFNAKHEDLSPEAAEPEDMPDEADAGGTDFQENDLRKCSLSGSLRATLVADGAPEWSLAVLYNNAEHDAEVYSINAGSNSIASDATLIEIRAREIIVRKAGHFERCLAEGEGSDAQPAAMTEPSSMPSQVDQQPTAEEPSDDDIQKTGSDSWKVSKAYLESEVLENLSKVATQARIVPSFKNGKPNGFKLFSIKPRSIFSKIGLQNGDVINSINGYEMNSPDKALEIYQKLKESSSITVELTRRGQAKTHSYAVQ